MDKCTHYNRIVPEELLFRQTIKWISETRQYSPIYLAESLYCACQHHSRSSLLCTKLCCTVQRRSKKWGTIS